MGILPACVPLYAEPLKDRRGYWIHWDWQCELLSGCWESQVEPESLEEQPVFWTTESPLQPSNSSCNFASTTLYTSTDLRKVSAIIEAWGCGLSEATELEMDKRTWFPNKTITARLSCVQLAHRSHSYHSSIIFIQVLELSRTSYHSQNQLSPNSVQSCEITAVLCTLSSYRH